MSLWSKLKASQKPGGGEWFTPGRYVCQVQRVVQGKARDGIDYFALEFNVLDVLVPTSVRMKGRDGTESQVDSLPKGVAAKQVIKLRPDIFETALGNYKSFVCAVLDLNESDLDSMSEAEFAQQMDAIVEDDGTALAGSYVIVNATRKETRGGYDFCQITYEAVDEAMV
jgi:hypothetical protein